MQRTGPPSISLPGMYCTLYPDSWETDFYIKLIKYKICSGRRWGRALRGMYGKCRHTGGLLDLDVWDWQCGWWVSCHSGFSFCSETFSFVLTGEDGSRRFGYCRRLLVIIPDFFSFPGGAAFCEVGDTGTHSGKWQAAALLFQCGMKRLATEQLCCLLFSAKVPLWIPSFIPDITLLHFPCTSTLPWPWTVVSPLSWRQSLSFLGLDTY